jgi:hypothetical protein
MIKAPTPSTPLTEYHRQLSQALPELFGNVIEIQMAANLLPQKFPHGLGRPYRGAYFWFTGFGELRVMDPAEQTDAETNITIEDSVAAGGRAVLRVW